MPDDYTTAMMMQDIIMTVQDNAPPIVAAAIFLASVNFIIGWFMHSLSILAKAGRS